MCCVVLWNDLNFIYIFEITKLKVLKGKRRSHWSSAETIERAEQTYKTVDGKKKIFGLQLIYKAVLRNTRY